MGVLSSGILTAGQGHGSRNDESDEPIRMHRNGSADCTVRLIPLQKRKGCTCSRALAYAAVRIFSPNLRSLRRWSVLRNALKGLGLEGELFEGLRKARLME
jgi:hypothetical protein